METLCESLDSFPTVCDEAGDSVSCPEDEPLSAVIQKYWGEMQKEVSGVPTLQLYLAGLYRMSKEYERIETTINDMTTSVEALGTSPQLTNERARIRDNQTSLTAEGWKLLKAVMECLSHIHTDISKLKGAGEDESSFFDAMVGD